MKKLCICLNELEVKVFVGILLLLGFPYLLFWLNKDLNYSSSDYANILTSAATLLTAVYATFLLVPNYFKQKRAENLTEAAKEVLSILTETEVEIKKLFLLKDETIKSFYNDYAKEHIKVQFKLSFLLNKLRNGLLLVRKKVDLVKNEKIPNFVELVASLEQVLSQRPTSYPASFITINFLSECGLLNTGKDSLDLGKLKDLREVLLSIYELDEQ